MVDALLQSILLQAQCTSLLYSTYLASYDRVARFAEATHLESIFSRAIA
jgi:hypothetical protein